MAWLQDRDLGLDRTRHARMFLNRPDLGLAAAGPGTFTLTPEAGMLDPLRRDYQAMSGMIFGPAPDFDAVIAAVRGLEAALNATFVGPK